MFVKDVKDIYYDSKNLNYKSWIATKNTIDTNPHSLTLDYW